MYVTFIALALLATVLAKGTEYPVSASLDCKNADWGEWSECRKAPGCNDPNPVSWKEDVSVKKARKGRRTMAWTMKEKEKNAQEWDQCVQDGKCPVFYSEGPKQCIDGMAGNYPCHNIDLLYHLNMTELGYHDKARVNDTRPNGRANDIWGWVYGSDDYVMIGLSGGTSIVRITNPRNPEVLGFLYSATVASTWRDIKVVNDHAYIVSEAPDHGMQVLDLTQFNNMMEDNTRVLTADYHYKEIGNAHNIVSNQATNRVFIVGSRQPEYGSKNCNGGLHIVDVSQPKNPRFVKCFGDDGYTHDAQCVTYIGPDVRYQQKEICFAYNEDTFTIVDTEQGTNLSRVAYTGVSYTHQGWLTEDHEVALMDDEADELRHYEDGKTRTYIWDVRDLEQPVLRNVYVANNTVIDHNQYIRDDYVYQSNYEAGLRILKLDRQAYTLTEVAYFDVFPSSNSVRFAGTWSNYPYFEHGARDVVAVTSSEYGLFLVQPDQNTIENDFEEIHNGKQQRSPLGKSSCPVETRACENYKQC